MPIHEAKRTKREDVHKTAGIAVRLSYCLGELFWVNLGKLTRRTYEANLRGELTRRTYETYSLDELRELAKVAVSSRGS